MVGVPNLSLALTGSHYEVLDGHRARLRALSGVSASISRAALIRDWFEVGSAVFEYQLSMAEDYARQGLFMQIAVPERIGPDEALRSPLLVPMPDELLAELDDHVVRIYRLAALPVRAHTRSSIARSWLEFAYPLRERDLARLEYQSPLIKKKRPKR